MHAHTGVHPPAHTQNTDWCLRGKCHLRSFLWPLPTHIYMPPTHTQNRSKGTLQSVVMCFECYIEIRVKDFDLLAKVLASS